MSTGSTSSTRGTSPSRRSACSSTTPALEVVHGGDFSGNVTLTAIGAIPICSPPSTSVYRAPGGGITLNAGRDIAAGTAGATFNNDLLLIAISR